LKDKGLELDFNLKKFLLYFIDEKNKNQTNLEKLIKHLKIHKRSAKTRKESQETLSKSGFKFHKKKDKSSEKDLFEEIKQVMKEKRKNFRRLFARYDKKNKGQIPISDFENSIYKRL